MPDRRTDRAEDIALFRYGLVREAASEQLSKAERGRLVRELAERSHTGPDGTLVRVSRPTLDRWVRTYRSGGFAALHPRPHRVEPRTPEAFLEMASYLRREDPARTAAHIAELLRISHGWSPHERTLQRHLKAQGLTRAALTGNNVAFGRFEATRSNELWVGDALHGPLIAGRKAVLFCFLDDHSRLVTGHRFTYHEDTLAAQAALRRGILTHGLPDTLYLDNGSPFVSRHLLRALAVLGTRLVHSQPGRPQGRGKVERFFRGVREQFLVEVAHSEIPSLDVLEERFTAWCEQVYHRRVHSETRETPLERFREDASPRFPSPELVREAFLFSESRTATKTATVSLFGNHYEIDQALAGRRVELVFDPFDLDLITVRYLGTSFGLAVPHRIGRHVHPLAHPEHKPAPATGIDYLALVEERHRARTGEPIGYRNLASDAQQSPKEQS